ncbi:TSCPD domain-containing protein [Labrys neptuniae]
MNRHILPNRRPSLSFEVEHGLGGRHSRFTVSIGGDGETSGVREVFVSGPPSNLMDNVRDSAILLSLALQHGCPLETIRHALTRDDSDRPATVIGSVVAGIEGVLA